MALTVNKKPSGFRPVGGGELIYQFTEASVSGKSNYRVEISLNGITGTFQYRPDASLVIRADIAPIIRSALDMSFGGPRIVTTYVTYQAKWDGGSDSAVVLSGDVIYGYIGVENTLNRDKHFEITQLASGDAIFLVPTPKMYLFKNRNMYVEFFYNTLDADCTVTYYPGGFTSADLATGLNLSGKGFYSVQYASFYANGTITIHKTASPFTVYASIEVVVYEECDNPVHLRWVNDLGGISQWVFSYNQIFNFTPQLLWRDKVLTVEANIVNLEQWKMLQELNKDGVEYGDNQKVGQYVVDVTDESYPVTVFTIPEPSETWTKKAKHNFSLSFRYTELPNILL